MLKMSKWIIAATLLASAATAVQVEAKPSQEGTQDR
jgi:hypothetical protein